MTGPDEHEAVSQATHARCALTPCAAQCQCPSALELHWRPLNSQLLAYRGPARGASRGAGGYARYGICARVVRCESPFHNSTQARLLSQLSSSASPFYKVQLPTNCKPASVSVDRTHRQVFVGRRCERCIILPRAARVGLTAARDVFDSYRAPSARHGMPEAGCSATNRPACSTTWLLGCSGLSERVHGPL